MLTVTDLTKSFATPDGSARVVDEVGFAVAPAECYALLGPSGCGKTTTLRCIAGLEPIDAGRIEIGGKVVSDPARGIFVPTHQRAIGMVFQSYAIWPHFDVFVNVAYPLQVQRPRLSRDEIEARVMEVLGLVGMAQMARRPATKLSGGQQQRAALARAIVRRPALLLLDEPLSNLDARLRDSMRKELSDLIARIGITALLVTHDQAEAFAMAHRLAIMNEGRLVQEGTPRDIYARPRNAFVARFLGAANVLRGRVEGRIGTHARVRLDGSRQAVEIRTDIPDGADVQLILRPETLTILTEPARGAIAGTVESAVFQGNNVEYGIDVGTESLLRVITRPDLELSRDARVWIKLDDAISVAFRIS
jgi:ABC-type Fe3+/spermidine/putrescine transport system ATPase subunit